MASVNWKSEAPCFISTGNPGKLKEMTGMIRDHFPWITKIHWQTAQNAEETASTFLGNAQIKAHALVHDIQKTQPLLKTFYILSDDSGLCIDALNGEPGVFSARYAGDHVEPQLHIQKVLQKLEPIKEIEKRSAHFLCVLVLLLVEGKNIHELHAQGQCHGYIDFKARGNSGFGYDPIFLDKRSSKTFAELSHEEKNKVSHRKEAFYALRKKI